MFDDGFASVFDFDVANTKLAFVHVHTDFFQDLPGLKAVVDGLRLANTFHEAGHHGFSKIGKGSFLFNADPRKLAVPPGQDGGILFAQDVFVGAIRMDGKTLNTIDRQRVGEHIGSAHVEIADHTDRVRSAQ